MRAKRSLALLSLIATPLAWADVPNTFRNGDVADARQINENFESLDARLTALARSMNSSDGTAPSSELLVDRSLPQIEEAVGARFVLDGKAFEMKRLRLPVFASDRTVLVDLPAEADSEPLLLSIGVEGIVAGRADIPGNRGATVRYTVEGVMWFCRESLTYRITDFEQGSTSQRYDMFFTCQTLLDVQTRLTLNYSVTRETTSPAPTSADGSDFSGLDPYQVTERQARRLANITNIFEPVLQRVRFAQ